MHKFDDEVSFGSEIINFNQPESIITSASQVDSPQAIITSPSNANAVAAAALENKDVAFLMHMLPLFYQSTVHNWTIWPNARHHTCISL